MKHLLTLGLFFLPCFSQAQEVFYYGQGLEPLVRQEGAATCSIIALPGGAGVKDCDSGVDYALRDHLSSVRVVIDSEGHFKKYCDYSPYGRSLTQDGGCRYTGHDYDADLALVRTPTRFYEPGIGRFISVDPARQGWTPYKYGRNNPAVWLDPDGRSPRVGTLSDNLAIAGQPLFYQLHKFPSSSRMRDTHQARGVYIQEQEGELTYLSQLKEIVLDSGLVSYDTLKDFASYDYHFGEQLAESYDAIGLKEFRAWNEFEFSTNTYTMSEERHITIAGEPLYAYMLDHALNLAKNRIARLQLEIRALLEHNGRTPTTLDLAHALYQDQRYEHIVISAGVANCTECSTTLWGRVVRQHPGLMVEAVTPSGIDHGFAIIGRNPNTDIRNPEGWNPEAVLADPWLGEIHPARDFYRRGYNPHYGYLFDRNHGTNLSIDLTTEPDYLDGMALPRLFDEL